MKKTSCLLLVTALIIVSITHLIGAVGHEEVSADCTRSGENINESQGYPLIHNFNESDGLPGDQTYGLALDSETGIVYTASKYGMGAIDFLEGSIQNKTVTVEWSPYPYPYPSAPMAYDAINRRILIGFSFPSSSHDNLIVYSIDNDSFWAVPIGGDSNASGISDIEIAPELNILFVAFQNNPWGGPTLHHSLAILDMQNLTLKDYESVPGSLGLPYVIEGMVYHSASQNLYYHTTFQGFVWQDGNFGAYSPNNDTSWIIQSSSEDDVIFPVWADTTGPTLYCVDVYWDFIDIYNTTTGRIDLRVYLPSFRRPFVMDYDRNTVYVVGERLVTPDSGSPYYEMDGVLEYNITSGESRRWNETNGLIDDNVRDMVYDPVRKLLYVATDSGLSVIDIGVAYDTMSPDAISCNPGEGVPLNSSIIIRFNERMNHSSVEECLNVSPEFTFSLSWIEQGKALNLSPASPLDPNTTYRITIGEGAQDLAGNPMDASRVFEFTTTSTNTSNPGGFAGFLKNENIFIFMIVLGIAGAICVIYRLAIRKNKKEK